MEIALLKLLLAHILGDFFLQSNSWVTEKEKNKLILKGFQEEYNYSFKSYLDV